MGPPLAVAHPQLQAGIARSLQTSTYLLRWELCTSDGLNSSLASPFDLCLKLRMGQGLRGSPQGRSQDDLHHLPAPKIFSQGNKWGFLVQYEPRQSPGRGCQESIRGARLLFSNVNTAPTGGLKMIQHFPLSGVAGSLSVLARPGCLPLVSGRLPLQRPGSLSHHSRGEQPPPWRDVLPSRPPTNQWTTALLRKVSHGQFR